MNSAGNKLATALQVELFEHEIDKRGAKMS